MVRSIGRLIRARQEERIIETLIELPVKFHILHDVRYAPVRVDADQAVNKSTAVGKHCLFD
jgi:hypothetical protein